MPQKTQEKIIIKNSISDTLFINIKMKALEHFAKNSILQDEFSFKLYKDLDYDFSKFPSKGLSRIGVCVRAKYFDEKVKKFIKNNENCVVVFVGTGLDTRYFRINAQELKAKFYELDLPDVIELRKDVFKGQKTQNIELISASMFDTSWMDNLQKNHLNSQFLFVVEGVIMYFEKELIKEFFVNLASRFSGEIICDLLNVWASKNSNKHDVIKDMEAKFKFGIDELNSMEKWHKNIKLLESVSIMKVFSKRWGVFKFLTIFKAIKNATRLVTFKLLL